MEHMAKPQIVSEQEWQHERDELLKAEKEATRALDALAARRRRLPMVKVGEYVFDSPRGPKTLVDLFDGRDQLVAYQFMDVGPDKFCPGCTAFTNNVTDLDDLAESGVSWATVSNMPLAQIESLQGEDGLDDAVRVVARHVLRRRLRRRGRLPAERVPARRLRRLPHLLHDLPRRGPADVHPQHPRPVPVRPSAGLGGLTGRLAAEPDLRITRLGLQLAASRGSWVPGGRNISSIMATAVVVSLV